MDLDRIARTTASTVARVTRAALSGEDEAAVSNHAAQDGLVDSGEADPAETAPSPLTGRQVGVLASFGIGPENLDDEAQARMAQAIGRLDGMLAGPGADGGDQEILLEEADYTLSLKVGTDPQTGEPSSRLLYIDADGTYISGLSNQPVETLFAPEPQPSSALPGWLSTLAGLDADYDVLTRLGGAMQVAGGAADLAVAVPLLLAPEPTMLTKVAAGAAGLRGFDDVQAGLRTVISGESTDTVTQTLATDAAVAMGAAEDTARTIGLAVDVVTGLLNPAGRLRHVTTAMAEELAQEAAEQAGRHADEASRGLHAADDLGEASAKRAGTAEKQLTEAGAVKPVPLTPNELARVLEWQDLRNAYLKKWRDVDLSAWPEKTQHLLRGSADNAIRGGMTPDDLAAVIKERRGVRILDEEGNPYNHLKEARYAMESVAKTIKKIQERIGYLYATAPEATEEIVLLEDKLSDLSTTLDAYERLQ